MPLLDLSYIAFKPEAVPGTYINPSYAADLIPVYGYTITPIKSTKVQRSIDVPYAGKRPSLLTAVHAGHDFSTELSGSGVATTAAFWGKLLQSCLFGAPVPTGTNVGYPLSSAGDGFAASILGNKDSGRARATMLRGNAAINFTEKQLPRIDWKMLGLQYGGTPFDSAAVAGAVVPTYPAPVEVNLANTVIVLDGYTLGVQSLSIDLGMKTILYSTTGSRAIVFDKTADADRRGITGTLVAELPDPATKNYFPAALAGTRLTMSLTHGLVAGNIVQMGSPGFVPGEITFTTVSNRLFMNMPFELIPGSTGNDELTITTL